MINNLIKKHERKHNMRENNKTLVLLKGRKKENKEIKKKNNIPHHVWIVNKHDEVYYSFSL